MRGVLRVVCCASVSMVKLQITPSLTTLAVDAFQDGGAPRMRFSTPPRRARAVRVFAEIQFFIQRSRQHCRVRMQSRVLCEACDPPGQGYRPHMGRLQNGSLIQFQRKAEQNNRAQKRRKHLARTTSRPNKEYFRMFAEQAKVSPLRRVK